MIKMFTGFKQKVGYVIDEEKLQAYLCDAGIKREPLDSEAGRDDSSLNLGGSAERKAH